MCENNEVEKKGLTLHIPAQARPEKQGLRCSTRATCENGDMGLRKRYCVNTLMRKSGKKTCTMQMMTWNWKLGTKDLNCVKMVMWKLGETGDVKVRKKNLHHGKLVMWKSGRKTCTLWNWWCESLKKDLHYLKGDMNLMKGKKTCSVWTWWHGSRARRLALCQMVKLEKNNALYIYIYIWKL